jgi:transcription elongation factor Elf1
MPQPQWKQPCLPVTVSCSHCQQEQVVLVHAHTGSWSMAHQSVKCFKCGQWFDVMVSDAILSGPFPP